MGVAVLALVGVLISVYMSAYHFGWIGSIMCGTGGCERVQNSPWANLAGVPVPVIGFLGYGALLVLAVMGIQERFEGDRRIALLLTSGAIVGVAFSAYLTWLEAAVIHAWCRWCIVSAILATLIFLFIVPEFSRLRSRNE